MKFQRKVYRFCAAPEYTTYILVVTVLVTLWIATIHTSGSNQSEVKQVSWLPFFIVVLAGGFVIFMQAYANYWRQWYDPKWALYFSDRFDSKEMIEHRVSACSYYKEHKEWKDEAINHVDRVLDLIEDVARVINTSPSALEVQSTNRTSQSVQKRHLCRLQFSSGNVVRKKARLVDFWKLLVFARAWRPFQFE